MSAVSQSPYLPRRTQALPKNSLFGCDLEMYTKDDISAIKSRDIKAFAAEKEQKHIEQMNKYKPSLPTELKDQLPAKAMLDETRDLHTAQERETGAAKKALDSLEKNSLFFQVGVSSAPMSSSRRTGRGSAVDHGLDSKDYTGDSNVLGLIKPNVQSASAPRRNARKKAPENHLHKELYAYHRHKGPDWLPKEYFMRDVEPDPNIPVDLPRNIQHRFGTDQCRHILKDSEKINNYFERRRARHSKKPHEESAGQKTENKANRSAYDDLGQSLRQDFFPGIPNDHHVGVLKKDFSEDVHKRRVKDPDEWRYQKDELSQWREQDVIGQRQKKDWAKYEEALPKFQANWDRDAKRPPPAPKPPGEKPKPVKPKPKPVKKDLKKSPSPFGEVVFKTPPLTPPPPKPEMVKRPSYTRDDEFWDFYDQTAPK